MKRAAFIAAVMFMGLPLLFSASFTTDNVLEGAYGAIHYGLYVPDSYDGSQPYALFITLPGYEGLYFQGEGRNLECEDFAWQAMRYESRMIIAAVQLMDWGERSARQTIELTEYLIRNYSIDSSRIYLEGFSAGGETGSLVMGMRPDLYTAFLAVSTRWDGSLASLSAMRRPVYMAVGAEDSYYSARPLTEAYEQLCRLYRQQGLAEEEIAGLAVLDIRSQDFFSSHGFSDQHAGGSAFAFDEKAMGWLFSQKKAD